MEIPAWLRVLERDTPKVLKRYQALETEVMKDGALNRKIKEIILLAVSSAIRDQEGVQFHMAQALKHGANKREIIEAVEVTLLSSGIPGIIMGLATSEEAK